MGPLGIVEIGPPADVPLGHEAVVQPVQVDRLVLERPPEPFDKDIVHAPAPIARGVANPALRSAAG